MIKIIKAIIAALQKLISAIIAGGWVSVVVILVICLIALLCWSVYGLFASAKANDGEYTMHNIITRINNEFNEKITDIESKEEYIRNLFWEINKIDHRIERTPKPNRLTKSKKTARSRKLISKSKRKPFI